MSKATSALETDLDASQEVEMGFQFCFAQQRFFQFSDPRRKGVQFHFHRHDLLADDGSKLGPLVFQREFHGTGSVPD